METSTLLLYRVASCCVYYASFAFWHFRPNFSPTVRFLPPIAILSFPCLECSVISRVRVGGRLEVSHKIWGKCNPLSLQTNSLLVLVGQCDRICCSPSILLLQTRIDTLGWLFSDDFYEKSFQLYTRTSEALLVTSLTGLCTSLGKLRYNFREHFAHFHLDKL